MSTVQELIKEKGSQVLSTVPETSVLDAALLMNEHKIGCLVVTEAGRVAGIITERDVLQKVVAARVDPAKAKVGEVMTNPVYCCRRATELEEARYIFKTRRIRHLPVVDEEGMLQGLISIGDLNAWQSSAQELTITYLNEYIYGRV